MRIKKEKTIKSREMMNKLAKRQMKIGTVMEELTRKYVRLAVATVSCAAVVALSGCSLMQEKIYTSSIFAMDTIMELQIAGKEDHTSEAEELIRNLEKSLSVTDPDSQISKLNSSGEAEISEQVADIMTRALDLCKRTDGDLDITIYPVLKAWGFTTGKYRVPSDEELQELLAKVDYRNVKLLPRGNGADEDAGDSGENGTGSDDMGLVANVTLPEGVQVDLGSVAKGYTGSYVEDELRELGVTSALLNLGGNVQCVGVKPN